MLPKIIKFIVFNYYKQKRLITCKNIFNCKIRKLHSNITLFVIFYYPLIHLNLEKLRCFLYILIRQMHLISIYLTNQKTTDYMTADWYHLPYEVLGKISTRIINEVRVDHHAN